MSTEVKPTDWDAEDNMWEPTPSGGGSGLPSYTSADKGKVLTVGAVYGEISPFCDTQVVTFENSAAPLTNTNYTPADVNIGDKVVFYTGPASGGRLNPAGEATYSENAELGIASFVGEYYDIIYPVDGWVLLAKSGAEDSLRVQIDYKHVVSAELKWENVQTDSATP